MRPALLTLLVALAAAAPAEAAYPGANGMLVFFQDGVGGVEPVGLAVSDADGKNNSPPLGPLCGGEQGGPEARAPCPDDPVWSPDGMRIAFGLGSTVATMKPDGTDVVRLPLRGLSRVTSPSYSPDGTRIAFSALRAGKRNVFITNLAGTTVVALTSTGGGAPAWSVKNEIAFTRRGNVWRVRATGGRAVRLMKRGGAAPTWSPSGNELAFQRKVRLKRKSKKRTPVLYRLGRNGRGLKRLTRSYSENPSWTPDGKAVLFNDFDSFNLVIYSVRRAGGKPRFVTGGDEGRRNAVAEPDQQPLPR